MALAYKPTPLEEIPKIIANVRKTFETGKTKPLQYRKEQLKQLYHLVRDNKEVLLDAVYKDLRKPREEAELTELSMIIGDIADALDHIDEWVKPVHPSVSAVNALDGCQIVSEPLGVILIIGAWNYPYQLCLVGLVGAIAAGNAVILKPSEISGHSAQVMADLIPKYLDPSAYQVINGAIAETSAVLENKFDHIMYTGSGNVGKVIMAAASKHLCPVTLELGGKSPAIIDSDVDMTVAARRIVWGRYMNSGQTCIAPDYVLLKEDQKEKFVEQAKVAIKEFWGDDPQKSNSLSRIVNANHFKRISNLLSTSGGKVAVGGKTDEKDLYIAPTIVTDVNPEAPVMQQEIFGPILPVVTVPSVDQAIDFVNKRDKPLALYVFSNNKDVIKKVMNNTSSGGFVGNDTLMHVSVPELPFGGVGPSGMGAYHGKITFDLFSHKKSVMIKDLSLEFVNTLRYPPYSQKKVGWIAKLLFKVPKEGGIKFSWKPIIVVLLAGLFYYRLMQTNPGFFAGVQAFFGFK